MNYVDYDNSSGDIKKKIKNIKWHYNEKGIEALKTNDGNCGGTANLVNYILVNDYEEVGIINHSCDTGQGGHVYNYIKYNGKYYVIDFLQYVMKDYNRYNYEILELDQIDDYPPYCIRSYGGNGHDIKIIVAYEADNQIPIGSKFNVEERVMRFFPKEYSDIIKVLY
ncbi:transglutaminase-like domain-containing protein, partial [Clostridiaceae bacterium HSG29]|nr:transglutaminase-like domain-containing protein [Clostridiaceae bacterium HSG29]